MFLNLSAQLDTAPCHQLVQKLCGCAIFQQSLAFPKKLLLHYMLIITSVIQIATNPSAMSAQSILRLTVTLFMKHLECKVIPLPYIPAALQVDDIFTKAMTLRWHQFLVGKQLLVDYQHQLEGDVTRIKLWDTCFSCPIKCRLSY